MKKCIILTVFCSVCTTFVYAQSSSQVHEWIRKKDFHRVQSWLAMPAAHNNPFHSVYAAVVLNAFGKADSSNAVLAAIDPASLPAGDTVQYFYYKTRYDNDVKQFHYRQAAGAGTLLLEQFKRFYTEEDLKEEKEALAIWKGIAGEPVQQLEQPASSVIVLKRDIAGLWNIPVNNGDSTHGFVFDSGAGISVVSDSYANFLRLRIIENVTTMVPSGISGIPTRSRIGIAPSFTIGDLVIKNALFLVFPDEALTFANGAYVIDGIIGFPIIREMGVLQFSGDTLVAVKNSLKAAGEPNLTLDGLKPVIYLTYQDELLPFTFDFGASSTIFSDVMYKRYKTDFDKAGRVFHTKVAGTSGARTLETVKLPVLELGCAGKKIRLADAVVSKEVLHTNSDIYYGNIGQDVIGQFKTMEISFKDCYVRFE